MEIVPDNVIGPPVRPVPVSISVTVPPAIVGAVETLVMRPKVSMVTTGIALDDPNVPVDTPVLTKLIVGSPVEPSPLATAMLPDVPAIDFGLITPPLTPIKPVDPDMDWKLAKNVPSSIRGSPLTPFALVMSKPVPTSIARGVSVFASVLTIKPLPTEFKLAGAPVKLICSVP